MLNRQLRESIEGFACGKGGQSINHLQFADGMLIFSKDSKNQIRMIIYVLRSFEAFSGLRINFSKSIMYGVSDAINHNLQAENLGCKVGAFPAMHLGLPSDVEYKKRLFG